MWIEYKNADAPPIVLVLAKAIAAAGIPVRMAYNVNDPADEIRLQIGSKP